jgi:hypothetical protein
MAPGLRRRPTVSPALANDGFDGYAMTIRREPLKKRWSQRVTERSNALDLERGVFAQRDPKRIARSLKRSAERSRRRKSDPYRSAMSMITFYVNRAGRKLPAAKRKRLEAAKNELRRLYRKPEVRRPGRAKKR